MEVENEVRDTATALYVTACTLGNRLERVQGRGKMKRRRKWR